MVLSIQALTFTSKHSITLTNFLQQFNPRRKSSALDYIRNVSDALTFKSRKASDPTVSGSRKQYVDVSENSRKALDNLDGGGTYDASLPNSSEAKQFARDKTFQLGQNSGERNMEQYSAKEFPAASENNPPEVGFISLTSINIDEQPILKDNKPIGEFFVTTSTHF